MLLMTTVPSGWPRSFCYIWCPASIPKLPILAKQGGIMTLVGPKHIHLHGPLLPLKKKKCFLIVLYDCVGVKMNILILYIKSFSSSSFCLLILKVTTALSWTAKIIEGPRHCAARSPGLNLCHLQTDSNIRFFSLTSQGRRGEIS